MKIFNDLLSCEKLFIDIAPVIYYIEAHPRFGPLMKSVIDAFQSNQLFAYSSVITLMEVLPKPVSLGKEDLAKTFSEFLQFGNNIQLVEISSAVAEKAGRLRAEYVFLKGLDAIQVAAALAVNAKVFLTNDKKFKRINEIEVFTLDECL